jgi:hypothetical protein
MRRAAERSLRALVSWSIPGICAIRASQASMTCAWLRERHAWPGLNSVVVGESVREIGGRIERETRFYLNSLLLPAKPQQGVIPSPHFPCFTT